MDHLTPPLKIGLGRVCGLVGACCGGCTTRDGDGCVPRVLGAEYPRGVADPERSLGSWGRTLGGQRQAHASARPEG